MKEISPLRRTIGAVLFVIGFAWLALGVGLVQGSAISNNAWAALFGLVCIAATGFVLGPAVLRRPLPTAKDLEDKAREQRGEAPTD